jgi:hypothetical protein
MKYKLLEDITSFKRIDKKHPMYYGKAGDEVTIIAEFEGVCIVQHIKKGIRFPVLREKLEPVN